MSSSSSWSTVVDENVRPLVDQVAAWSRRAPVWMGGALGEGAFRLRTTIVEAEKHVPYSFSRWSMCAGVCFGGAIGYVIGKWVEPAFLRFVADLRFRLREARISMSRWEWRRRKAPPPPAQKGLKQKSRLNRTPSLGTVDIVSKDVPVDSSQMRTSLDDGDLVCLFFDGTSYELASFPTTRSKSVKKPTKGRFATKGRLIDDCSEALSHLGPAADRQSTKRALEKYLRDQQKPRYALGLKHLERQTRACIAILRLVRLPAEPTQPPRAGDLLVVYVPSADDPNRSIQERTATTPVVVNRACDALTKNGILAPYTIRIECPGGNPVDKPGEPLDYNTVYKKLFQTQGVLPN